MRNTIFAVIMKKKFLITALFLGVPFVNIYASAKETPDSVFPKAISGRMQWRVGMEVAPAYVLPTNDFVKGYNVQGKSVKETFTGTMRGDFSFNSRSEKGRLYHGLYQGVGVDIRSFFRPDLLGTPVSAYVLQGAPIKNFTDRLSLGYEWRFGCAFGWADRSHDYEDYFLFPAVCTRVTAHMAVSLKLNYKLSTRWLLSAGIDATHFSNGNTSFPNAGINTVGASVGVSYVINPDTVKYRPTAEMIEEADRKRWVWDVMAYGAWRKREYGGPLMPGSYGVAGVQFTAARRFNRYFDAGLALDIKYDGSAGKKSFWENWVESGIRPGNIPFFKRCSVGLGAVAEFTMPIFTIGAGVGFNLINPEGDQRFYQLLYIKTFVTRNLYLNTGYRLGDFKAPQNLMLGLGYRW